MSSPRMGLAGRLAAAFQDAAITPLLALVALLLGVFAVLVTPREEEPQIDVTMANVIVPFPGASSEDVAALVATPAERVLARMAGVEHVMSVSRPGVAVITVQFEVGVPRTEALVRLNDTVQAHADWLPAGLGVMPPLLKPKGIDDVPIMALTLHGSRPPDDAARPSGPTMTDAYALGRVAQSIVSDLKRVPGTRDVLVTGDPGRAVVVEVDGARLAAAGLTLAQLSGALQGANLGQPVGELVAGNRAVEVHVGDVLRSADDVAALIVGAHAGKPIALGDVATVRDGAPTPQASVWYGGQPAITLALTKKPGANAITVARQLEARVAALKNTAIPDGVQVTVTRNYGETANAKAVQLITKLAFATASVVLLVALALGRREAAIVGVAVVLTLAATLFASWAWGFTLNRVSLFALIFSIGILVDDAIVVVENIHRHMAMDVSAQGHIGAADVSRSQNSSSEHAQEPSPIDTADVSRSQYIAEIIPPAVDEVGGPTILATFTVIAALLPMAFVSGLMGPYMAPIPINASLGMLLSLAVAFVITPWLARRWMRGHHVATGIDLSQRLAPLFERLFAPLLTSGRARAALGLGVLGLIAISLALPATGLVVLKMLPFDNKSEFQVVVDMPPGTPMERTAAVLAELGAQVQKAPEVADWQAYAGTAAPINFNGLVRQYDGRRSGELGDLQVNLKPKGERALKSHAIALRERPALHAIAARHGARLKVVEVPPGPPVQAPIVAEIYGPDADGRRAVAAAVRKVFAHTQGIVDVDSSHPDPAPRVALTVDRRKAALLGVSQAAVVDTLATALQGRSATWLHVPGSTPMPAWLQLDARDQGRLDALLNLQVPGAAGQQVPLRELVRVGDGQREEPIFHKDLLPVSYVVGDMAGRADSPLYGLFSMRSAIAAITAPDGQPIAEHFITQPADPYRGYAIKWDGEWQITYETFRDMGAAYAVGLVLIYLLVVAQFKSYLTPLIIMAPIPLTLIGVMPGHALLGAPFTATSMIGMIALAGIIVRNSILLVDFVNLQLRQGVPLARAIVQSAIARAQPIVLTGLAAMIGAVFILGDPIFNGLAISLIFGIAVSTALTLVVIPLLYFMARRGHPV